MSTIPDLKAKIAELQAELDALEGPKVSPLAPAGGDL